MEELRDALSLQNPTPNTQLAQVDGLQRANTEIGDVYGDIDSIVSPIRFGDILTETDRAVEAYRSALYIIQWNLSITDAIREKRECHY